MVACFEFGVIPSSTVGEPKRFCEMKRSTRDGSDVEVAVEVGRKEIPDHRDRKKRRGLFVDGKLP